MHGRFRAAMLTASLLLTMAVAAPAASAAKPTQLALGDSWAAGVLDVSGGGYVTRLHTALQDSFDCSPSDNPKPGQGCHKLELVDLSRGGATTTSLIATQLAPATELLAARNATPNPRDDVEVVTLHIGGNDIFGPIIGSCLGGITPACGNVVSTVFTGYATRLHQILGALRGAAGPDTRIVLGTYDNPIPTCQLGAVPGASTLGALVLEGGGPIPAGLHDVMRSVAAAYDVEIAEVHGDLAPADWLGGSDCLHPNDTGHEKVKDAFLDVLT